MEIDRTDVPAEYAGSAVCRDCHEQFYELWAPSHHGLAMQPFTAEFSKAQLTSHTGEIAVGSRHYRYVQDQRGGWIVQKGSGEQQRYEIQYALGGKNVYYFLTPTERGRLQVLPLAFDVRQRQWFDTTASMVRHFGDREDEAIDWTESPLTFNTACFNCHVSQLSTNYDLETDSYRTVWMEPGINCETCHGPGSEHIRVCSEVPEGTVPDDLKIILTSAFSEKETNDLCAPCHAKMFPLTDSFVPGDEYFDHFGLHTLEHADFYPDGRDLGENYTFTLWRMSPCVQAGALDCMHCHTSSGRNRHIGDEADNACLPCHKEYVDDPADHSFHLAESEGSRCVSCHMPRTVFAKMERHDHTMLPPVPAATQVYGSPNACNLCHSDEESRWAEEWVERWYGSGYENDYMFRAGLIDAARKRDWSQLEEILRYILNPQRDEVFSNSLIRLLENCEDQRKWPVLLEATGDPSPLIRSSAVSALSGYITEEGRRALIGATADETRLVRIRAAAALSSHSLSGLTEVERGTVEKATAEYVDYLRCGPDQWSSHYNLANYYVNLGRLQDALKEFNIASRLQPQSVPPLVNASMIHARLGQPKSAENKLRRAYDVDPRNAIVNYNLGLLLAEQGRHGEARKMLEAALREDPQLYAAAYNLAILVAESDLEKAISWCRRASEGRPEDPKYAYTLAFYLFQSGQMKESRQVLEELLKRDEEYLDAYTLLGMIHEQGRMMTEAAAVYRRALKVEGLTPAMRFQLETRLESLQ